jgi:phosphate transport system ATP-binding protein
MAGSTDGDRGTVLLRKIDTILAVSHSLRQVRRLADRVIVLRDGGILQEMHKQHLEDYEMFQKLIEAAF